jgi:hypothetical protein
LLSNPGERERERCNKIEIEMEEARLPGKLEPMPRGPWSLPPLLLI